MPRNEAKPLSSVDAAVQAIRHSHLVNKKGSVSLMYTKRDGTLSSSTGEVTAFSGRPGFDTGSVTIADPVKGARTINLHRIIKIQ